MADVELVIKIDTEQYEFIRQSMTMDKVKDYHALLYDICERIKNGISLPKGHGRILDEKDILNIENNDGGWYDLVDMPEYIAGVKAIIEADKAERSE